MGFAHMRTTRAWFTILIGASAAALGATPATSGKLTSAQLAEKARRLQAVLEDHIVQAHGLVPMFVRANDYQLPTAEDYAGSYRHRHLRGKTEAELGMPPTHIWRAWENTPSDTAFYLAALAYQYRVTGDPEVLARCRRTLAGLKYIYALPIPKGERGFLCKPYGGVYSNQSSGDQLQCVTWGLAAYRPIAPPENLVDIDTMMRDFVDFQMKTEYVSPYGYFGRSAEELRREPSYQSASWYESRALIYLPSIYLAWQGTGDAKYVAEAQRWMEACGAKADFSKATKRFSTNGYGGRRNLYLGALLMEMDPAHHVQWRAAMLSEYQQARTGLLKDGTWPTMWSYDSATQRMTPTSKPSSGLAFGRTGRSTIFAMGCVAAQRWFSDVDMVSDARRILEGVDEDTCRLILPMDDQTPLPADWQVESKLLDGDCLTAWLCAYWEGRYRGYW